MPSYEANIKLSTLERLFSLRVDICWSSPHVKAIIVYCDQNCTKYWHNNKAYIIYIYLIRFLVWKKLLLSSSMKMKIPILMKAILQQTYIVERSQHDKAKSIAHLVGTFHSLTRMISISRWFFFVLDFESLTLWPQVLLWSKVKVQHV